MEGGSVLMKDTVEERQNKTMKINLNEGDEAPKERNEQMKDQKVNFFIQKEDMNEMEKKAMKHLYAEEKNKLDNKHLNNNGNSNIPNTTNIYYNNNIREPSGYTQYGYSQEVDPRNYGAIGYYQGYPPNGTYIDPYTNNYYPSQEEIPNDVYSSMDRSLGMIVKRPNGGMNYGYMEDPSFYENRMQMEPRENIYEAMLNANPNLNEKVEGYLSDQSDPSKNNLGSNKKNKSKSKEPKGKMKAKNIPQEKDNYLDLLVNSVVNFLKTEKDYDLYTPVKKRKEVAPPSPSLETKIVYPTENLGQKCENKICPTLLTKGQIHIANLKSAKFSRMKLCSKCFQAFQKGQYCYYCGIIYREYKGKKGFNDHKIWIACDYCNNWEHIQCEEKFGMFRNLSSLIHNKNFKYKCPVCCLSSNDTKEDEFILGKKRKLSVGDNYFNFKFIFQNEFNKDEIHHNEEIAKDFKKIVDVIEKKGCA
ncbi:MAG: hypothetical protein MJ252_13345 [archaeon]|nr:hypothetical protein [archaeon]